MDVFILDVQQERCQFLEFTLKREHISTYSLCSSEEFVSFFCDLKPKLLIVHESYHQFLMSSTTIQQHWRVIKTFVMNEQISSPLVWPDDVSVKEFILPLKPLLFKEEVRQILKSMNLEGSTS